MNCQRKENGNKKGRKEQAMREEKKRRLNYKNKRKEARMGNI
jgi:hypothetical protein